jgi:UDPglucose 6-dehydrogenase/GDP-mannose 6-dehydrogenase
MFKEVPTLRTNNKTAEMVKYASNSLQATAISFANEIGNLCAAIGGVDAMDVMEGVHLMKELNPSNNGGRARAGIANFLSPGCGFGGSCFPKDVKALIAHGGQRGASMRLLQAVIDTNRDQPTQVVELTRRGLGSLAGARVAMLGLAFKPDTDDMRESPAIPIVNGLLAAGAVVRGYDPIATAEARKVFENRIEFAGNLPSAIVGAAAIVLVTRWSEFKALPKLLEGLKEQPLVVDGRRMLDPKSVARYVGVGLAGKGEVA